MPQTIEKVKKARRIIVKIGSAVLGKVGEPGFNRPVIAELAGQIASIRNEGREVVLVSSGAILAGSQALDLNRAISSIGDKQALAAIGQVELMYRWREIFSWHNIQVAQVLLTRDDLSHRRRFLNARRTLRKLLEHGVLPIINENDTVMIEEIKLGDNDQLSALVTNVINADLLVILTEVDGVFDADPRCNESAVLLERIEEFNANISSMSGKPGPAGRGGMATKIQAAHMACLYGVPTVIANGTRPNVLNDILAGKEVGTVVVPQEEAMDSRKHWIAFNHDPSGKLFIDKGAANAILTGGKSLLPSGIMDVEGEFDMGDLVQVIDPDQKEIARGISSYNANEIKQIKGLKSSEITSVLGYKTSDEAIHRDHLVVGEMTWRKTNGTVD